MNELTLKYNLLDINAQKEVLDFIDFLINKKKSSKKISNYKKKILSVSVWSDEDIQEIEKSKNAFNQWNIQSW